MRVKRYIVDTMPDAMLKIRGELGADAVILSTKEMKIGGFLGMFRKKKIEVIAATDTAEKTAAKEKQPPPQPPVIRPVARQAVPEAYRKSAQLVTGDGPHDPLSKPLEEALLEIKAAAGTQASKLEDNINKSKLVVNSEADQSKEDKLFEEIKQMKSLMSKLALSQTGEQQLPEGLKSIQEQLQVQGVVEELADTWIAEAYQQWVDSNETLTDEQLKGLVRQSLTDFLSNRIGEGIASQTRIVYVAGPTGVGKTTTIAKLAADQIFRVRKKVGFITADTYRISAIEQLRTYASILNVPIEVVQSPGDVKRAMQRLEHCDLILMDTAGRNYLNEMFVAELHSLFSPSETSETFLVLSLTSKFQDMRTITENFSKYRLDKVIFTKQDETESVGPIFNLLHEYPLKVSYITNGQNVPDDLLTADSDLLIDMLLEENRHE